MEHIEVSGVSLTRMINSQEFDRELAAGAEYTAGTGHESGFAVFRDPETGRDFATPSMRGSATELRLDPTSSGGQSTIEMLSRGRFEVLDLHLHPQMGYEPLALSYSDFLIMDSADREYETRPIAAVGAMTGKRDGYLLLMQRTFTGFFGDGEEGIGQQVWERYQEIADVKDPEVLATALQWPGYLQTAVVGFRLEPKMKRAVIRGAEAIRKFAYVTAMDDPDWIVARQRQYDDF